MFLVTFFTLFVTIFHRIDSVNSFQFARNFQSHLVKHQTNRITLPRNRCETIKFSSTIDENDDEDEIMEAESSSSSPPPVAITNIEKAWRHVKKPLLRIGSKGAAPSHGNSLRQLLEQHDTVKVKINTWKLGKIKYMFHVKNVICYCPLTIRFSYIEWTN